MRAEDNRDAIGDLIERFDENRALRLQRVNDIAVVHNLVPDIDRRAIFLQREFDDADRAIDAGAETARRRDQNLEFRRFAASGRRSEEHTSETQSLMCNSYAVFRLKIKITIITTDNTDTTYTSTPETQARTSSITHRPT